MNSTMSKLAPTAGVRQEYRLGKLGFRALAAVADSVLGLPVFFGTGALTAYFFGLRISSSGKLELWNEPFVVDMVLNLAVWVAYYVMLEWYYGSTLGKAIFGLEVRDSSGGRCRFGQVLLRNLVRLIDAIGFYFVGFLAAMSTPLRQRLGDRYGRTIVTKKPAPRRVMATVLWLVANVALIAFAYFSWQLVPSA